MYGGPAEEEKASGQSRKGGYRTEQVGFRAEVSSTGLPQQHPQQPGNGADPQERPVALQAHGGAAVTLAALTARHGQGSAVGRHGAVGTRWGTRLHHQDAARVGCGERAQDGHMYPRAFPGLRVQGCPDPGPSSSRTPRGDSGDRTRPVCLRVSWKDQACCSPTCGPSLRKSKGGRSGTWGRGSETPAREDGASAPQRS